MYVNITPLYQLQRVYSAEHYIGKVRGIYHAEALSLMDFFDDVDELIPGSHRNGCCEGAYDK